MQYEGNRSYPVTVRDLWMEVKRRLGDLSTEGVWLRGTIRDFKYSQHIYMVLEESSGSEPKARVSARIWGQSAQRISAELRHRGLPQLADGLSVVVHGRLDAYLPRGTLSVVVDALDYDALREEARREVDRIRRLLKAEGIYDANQKVAIGEVPLRIALVTSSAGTVQFDFGKLLAESGYAFSITLVPTPVTGEQSSELVAAAIADAAALDVDLVVVLRGGGAQSELAVFDSELVARAVAGSPRPVWCAIGHAADEVLINEVANRAFDVPQSAARAVVDQVGGYLLAFRKLVERARAVAQSRLDQEERSVELLRLQSEARVEHVWREEVQGLAGMEAELLQLARDQVGSGTHAVAMRRQVLNVKAESVLSRIGASIPAEASLQASLDRRAESGRRELRAIGKLLQAKDPAAVLARGYAILAAETGVWIRGRAALLEEEEVEAVLHDGRARLRLIAREGK